MAYMSKSSSIDVERCSNLNERPLGVLYGSQAASPRCHRGDKLVLSLNMKLRLTVYVSAHTYVQVLFTHGCCRQQLWRVYLMVHPEEEVQCRIVLEASQHKGHGAQGRSWMWPGL